MKTMFSKTCSLASLLLALTLTLSCSNGDGGSNNPIAGNPEYELEKESYKYYDPDSGRCLNGVIELKCGDKGFYNPLTHFCMDPNWTSGGVGYEIQQLCRSKAYNPYKGDRCQNGVVEGKCGDVWYNYGTHYCFHNTNTVKVKEICGSTYIVPDDGERCTNGVVEQKCGNSENWYNYITQSCDWFTGEVKNKLRCGSIYIEPDYERCTNGSVESICGITNDENATWYNIITQSCYPDFDEVNFTFTFTVKNKLRCGS